MLDAARERAEWTGALHKLHLDDIDIREFRADPETFHLTVMLMAPGASAAGIAGAAAAQGLDQGRRLRADRRRLLAAERPAAEYLAFSWAAPRSSSSTTAATCRPAVDAGLIPMHATTASPDDWDEYEWKYCRSIERYARELPDDPDVPAMLDRVRRWRDTYLRCGRDTLGFAVYLFYRPGAGIG